MMTNEKIRADFEESFEMRADFEESFAEHHGAEEYLFAQRESGEYVSDTVDSAWWAWRAATSKVTKIEREACARVCEKVAVDYYTRIGREHEPYMRATAEDCARHIRARGQSEERNFCPRCGKRTADLTTIHTCTPPQENT